MKIKPCPFCGSEDIKFSSEMFYKWYAYCANCGCRTGEMYESADYCVKDKLAEAWNKRAEKEQFETVYGYDIEQLILFAQCCKEVGITNDDLKNVEDCCRLAIDATEKAMVESFNKCYERYKVYERTD